MLGSGGAATAAAAIDTDSGPISGLVPAGGFNTQPHLTASVKTPFRPDVPCETQDRPDFDAPVPATPPVQP